MNSPQHPHPLARALAAVIGSPRPWQVLLLLLTGVVCFLALAPNPPQQVDLGWDKLNHLSAFAALALTGCFGFPGSRHAVLGVLVALLGLGALIEVLQSFVPGRSSEWADLGADALGMAIGAAVALSALRVARRFAPPA